MSSTRSSRVRSLPGARCRTCVASGSASSRLTWSRNRTRPTWGASHVDRGRPYRKSGPAEDSPTPSRRTAPSSLNGARRPYPAELIAARIRHDGGVWGAVVDYGISYSPRVPHPRGLAAGGREAARGWRHEAPAYLRLMSTAVGRELDTWRGVLYVYTWSPTGRNPVRLAWQVHPPASQQDAWRCQCADDARRRSTALRREL